DFELAKSQAKINNKPILLSFSGSDWCGWCIKLDNEVFSKPEFQKWSKENVILVNVDFPRRSPLSKELKQQNEALAAKYGVNGFPTVLLIDADGKVLGQTGYRRGGAEAYTAYLTELLKQK
ncbi:MAG: thioredoxin family protein, partial [Victivallaceae bacterium]